VTVYLVGAGPGDPGLITVRGAELLASADVVVYDRLASPRLLDLAPATAERIDVGKAPGRVAMRQPDIDRQELWDLFGRETVIDFFFVDSKPNAQGKRKGIDELKRAIDVLSAK